VAVDVTAGADYGYAMALQPDGRMIMAGWVGSDFGLIRLNSDGSRDMTFDDQQQNDGLVQIQLGTATDRAYAIALDPSLDPSDPRIVVAGSAGGDFAVVRLNSDGTLDTTFNGTGKRVVNVSNGSGTDEALAVTVREGDGAIVAAGYAQGLFAAAVFNADGTFDTSFSGDGKAYVDFTPTSTAPRPWSFSRTTERFFSVAARWTRAAAEAPTPTAIQSREATTASFSPASIKTAPWTTGAPTTARPATSSDRTARS
jgi:uncharacterized delta-60 repeat protein